jgi:hypothetical protein
LKRYYHFNHNIEQEKLMTAQTMQRVNKPSEQAAKLLAVIVFVYVLIRASIEFYEIAWGTGIWLGEFSFKWALGFVTFVLFCTFIWVGAILILRRPADFKYIADRIVSLRKKLGAFRWIVVVALLVFPVWFLQFTPWGVVFSGLYFRLVLWVFVAFGLAVFLKSGEHLLSWSTLLASLLLTSSVFSFTFAFIYVSDYPFSIGWSEGNRMWDYSLLFGRALYNYPLDQDVIATTDAGRQLVGGLPFVISGVNITVERFWVALTTIIPYLLLGLAAFRFTAKDKKLWLLLGLWSYVFLKQGPIHPPLVLCAFVVALLWRRPLWISIPLILVTSFLAEESRYTWMFAPGLWLAMLEFSGMRTQAGRLQPSTWWRTIVLGLSGALGAVYGVVALQWIRLMFASTAAASTATPAPTVTVSSVASSMTVHPLLWYRLFPNATYGLGIVLALLIAVAPTICLLVYLNRTKKWTLNVLQALAVFLPLTAFLLVGLIVSTKIGGGGDLHNMDMFLIGMLFTAVIAWENGGRQWLSRIDLSPLWVKVVLVLLLVLPGIQPLSALRSYQFAEDVSWLVTLTDVSDGKFLEMLPPDDEVDDILQTIRREVDARKSQGEVLFMDQRQLLTFGYVENVPLVPEYEKKVLMNAAMGANESYFSVLYAELEAKRFSLIISEPLRAPVKDSNYQFGEENNAWVEWVVEPVLCYYQEIETFRSAQIQLLVPKQGELDCLAQLPVEPATLE